jgi:rhodanese-related sulfurtransferase
MEGMSMRKRFFFTFLLVLSAATSAAAASQTRYPVKGLHKGGALTPREAHRLTEKDREHIFLIDVRTRYEYQDVGHPVGAYNIPWKFYTTTPDRRGYTKVLNDNFVDDLKSLFDPETDTLLFICRAGERSIPATDAAVEAGFSGDWVFNGRGVFEGDLVFNPDSPDYGKRRVGGWQMEGLPWTYLMEKRLMYQPDLAKER